ncbi:MAG: xylan 1,4-beta-xylosidase [Massilia sp.]|nr:MAG: xylan 1,4-beta-xylosidase [Massilia sp.]
MLELVVPACEPLGRIARAQRRPDLGDGTFLNPILPGDHPDPCLLKDGIDYYLTCSSFQFTPGPVIWHSRDLVNWSPIGPALTCAIGTVGAVDLVRHQGRYFLYLCVAQNCRASIQVVYADDIAGPWSDPIDLDLADCIGASHVVAADGSRHLFVNGIRRIQLSDDGLATAGVPVHVHTPPPVKQTASQAVFVSSGPRLIRRDSHFYLLHASASATEGQVLTVARSPSLSGPWEDCPFNPLGDSDSTWTTSGSGSLVEGLAGDWWLVCHGYERGHRSLGRQPLLQPVEWGRDGWFRTRCGTLAKPQRKPRWAKRSPGVPALSDDFSGQRIGMQWSFFDAGPDEMRRACQTNGGLLLAGKGNGLADCSPLTCVAADHDYEAELEFEVCGHAQGGLALFHDARGFVGVGIDRDSMQTYSYGQAHRWMQQPVQGRHHRLRLTHRGHLVSFHHATSDGRWMPNPWLQQVSVMHQHRFDGPHSLRLALFSAGAGEVRMKRFTYRRLDG